jgi:hypothetical protein
MNATGNPRHSGQGGSQLGIVVVGGRRGLAAVAGAQPAPRQAGGRGPVLSEPAAELAG